MLNENLAKIRKEQGLTQEALAAKLSVVRQTVSKWEKGTAVPDADTLCRIADALEVPVSVLLGAAEQEGAPDTASIAKSLAQISEQLALRNRRAANAWKVLCLILLAAVGVLIGVICSGSSREAPEAALPDKMEVSNVCFLGEREELICSFVPGIGGEDIVYTVTFHSRESGFPDASADARYENGICTASFDKTELRDYLTYCVVLKIDCGGEVRNLMLADDFHFREDGCSWQPQWD